MSVSESPRYRPHDDRLDAARLVISAAAQLVAATRMSDSRLDLESLQGRILQALTRRPWASIALLADMGDVSLMAVSKAVTALEHKGWVQRQQHPSGDHRRRSVVATESGVQVVGEIEAARAYDAAGALLYLPTADQTALIAAAEPMADLAVRAVRRRRYMRGEYGTPRWL